MMLKFWFKQFWSPVVLCQIIMNSLECLPNLMFFFLPLQLKKLGFSVYSFDVYKCKGLLFIIILSILLPPVIRVIYNVIDQIHPDFISVIIILLNYEICSLTSASLFYFFFLKIVTNFLWMMRIMINHQL